jgi:hypothetical protein
MGVRPEDADRLAGLDEERLVGREVPERLDDGVEGVPVPRGAARPAVDDQVLRVLADVGVEVVEEHAEGCLDLPVAAGDLGAVGSLHRGVRAGGHRRLRRESTVKCRGSLRRASNVKVGRG